MPLNPFTPNPFQQDPSYGGWTRPAWVTNTPDTSAMTNEGPVPLLPPQEGRFYLNPEGTGITTQRPAGPQQLSPYDLLHMQMLRQGGGQFPLQWPAAGDRVYQGPSDLGQFNPGEYYQGARTNQPRLPGLNVLSFLPPEFVEAVQNTTAQASADFWNWLLQNGVPEFADQLPSRDYAPIPAWLDR